MDLIGIMENKNIWRFKRRLIIIHYKFETNVQLYNYNYYTITHYNDNFL